MTCRELVDSLAAYLDGNLSDDVRASFDDHVAACAACAAYVATYRQTAALAKDSFREVDAPADVPDDVVKAILAGHGRG